MRLARVGGGFTLKCGPCMEGWMPRTNGELLPEEEPIMPFCVKKRFSESQSEVKSPGSSAQSQSSAWRMLSSRSGWLVRSMLAQSRPLAMRKLSLRDPVLLNQSAGTTCGAGRSVSGGGGTMCPGWGDTGRRMGVCSGVMSWLGVRKFATSEWEALLPRMLLARDLKEVQRSGKLRSS